MSQKSGPDHSDATRWMQLVKIFVAVFLIVFLYQLVKVAYAHFVIGQVRETMADGIEYPESVPMPAEVKESLPELLARLELAVQAKAPETAKCLQPGLSAERIQSLEDEFGVQLTDELRQLYRWHNGQNQDSVTYFTLLARFPPLENVLADYRYWNQSAQESNPLVKDIFGKMTSQQEFWFRFMPNHSGDAYIVDLKRRPEHGAVFYFVHDDFHWFFYPSLKNLIAAFVECYESGVMQGDPAAPDAGQMYKRCDEIHRKYGRELTDSVN